MTKRRGRLIGLVEGPGQPAYGRLRHPLGLAQKRRAA